MTGTSLKLMTWNLWCKGGSRQRPRHWIDAARLIAAEGADLVGLQEVDCRYGDRTDFTDVACEMAAELGFHHVFCPSIELPGAEGELRGYGNALLSRYPIVRARGHRLAGQVAWDRADKTTEPRSALEALVDVDGSHVRVLVTHLGVEAPDGGNLVRMQQTADLIRLLRLGVTPSLPTVLMGDFNAGPSSPEVRRVQEWMVSVGPSGHATTVADFEPDRGFDRPRTLDYIFVSPELAVHDAHVVRTRLSDHLPVRAVLAPQNANGPLARPVSTLKLV